jgi:hypothetical protein
MPRSRKEKRQHNDSAPEQRARVIKSGVYDGSGSSRDFVVSGHSTGSQNSEMEALSHQVSIDAGRVPDYNSNDSIPDLKDHGFGATADLDGPELYGPKPAFTGSGNLNEGGIPLKKIAVWSSIGAAGAALSYLAYRYYDDYQIRKSAEPIFNI